MDNNYSYLELKKLKERENIILIVGRIGTYVKNIDFF